MIDTLTRPDLVKTITACRSCGSGALDEVLDLGTHAVSDFYETVPTDELRAPLCLVQCRGCGLVQLTHSVSRDRLYKDYWYRSGLNPAMVAALKDVVDSAIQYTANAGIAFPALERAVVLDIGANDGTLLDQYDRLRFHTHGYEPSQLADVAREKNHRIFRGYYPTDRWGFGHYPAHIITSIACFYDLDDPNAFVRAIKADLHPDGIWVNQMMDLEGMLWANAFDNICHEHVAYWTQESFNGLAFKHGFRLDEMHRNAVNGGSLRHGFRHGVDRTDRSPTFPKSIQSFAQRIIHIRDQCLAFLEDCRYNGKTVLGYGASTKGNTLLQYYGIDPDLLPAIAERNPDKVGKLTAGSHIPIISEEEMRQRKPDYLLVLPWHFIDGFVERERDLIAQGTRLVVPLPTFRVLGG